MRLRWTESSGTGLDALGETRERPRVCGHHCDDGVFVHYKPATRRKRPLARALRQSYSVCNDLKFTKSA